VSLSSATEKVVQKDELSHENGVYYLEHEGKLERVYTVSYTYDGKKYFPYGMPEFWQLDNVMKIALPGFEVEGKDFQLLVKEDRVRKLPTTPNSKVMYIVRYNWPLPPEDILPIFSRAMRNLDLILSVSEKGLVVNVDIEGYQVATRDEQRLKDYIIRTVSLFRFFPKRENGEFVSSKVRLPVRVQK
jgi:hypothetical protein